MAELVANNGLLALVDKDSHRYGEVSEKDSIPYRFIFLGSPSQIEYVEKGCGCSSAWFDRDSNSIVGELDFSKANGNTEYSNGETAVQKFVFVWLNDGQPRFIGDDKKQKILNPKKAFFRLKLEGTVVK